MMRTILTRLAMLILSGLPGLHTLHAGTDPLETWHVRQPPVFPTTEEFEGVAYGNGRWVIVGANGSILSSADGVEWSAEINPAAPARLDDVAFGGGVFVAAGRSSILVTSPDGRQWTRHEPEFSGCTELIHDGSRFVAVLAGGFIVTSSDGVEWERPGRVPLNYDVGGVAYGNGVYVQAGYKRTGQPPDLFSAQNLTDWTPRDSKLDENLMNVGFGLGLFVAVGQDGALSTSPDGVEWSARTVPHTGFIWDVCSDGRALVAAGQWGRLLTSRDGVEWVRHETDLSWHLTDVAFGGGTFIAVGWNGQIVQSDPVGAGEPGQDLVLIEPKLSGGEIQFKFAGEVGKAYQVQVSSDLKHWQPLGTLHCTQVPMPFSDIVSPGALSYRVVRP